MDLLIELLSYLLFLCPLLAIIFVSYKNSWYSLLLSCLLFLAILGVRPGFIVLGFDYLIPYNEFVSSASYDIAYANLMVFIWLMFLFFGYQLVNTSDAILINNHINLTVYRLAGYVLGFVGVIATLKFMYQAGSIGSFMFLVKVDKAFMGLYLFRSLLILGAVFLLCSFILSSHKLASTLDAFFILVFLACVYLWGNRTGIAYFLLVSAFAYHILVRKISFNVMVFLVALFIVLLQFLRYFRNQSVTSVMNIDMEVFDSIPFIQKISLSLHMVEYDSFVLALRDVGERFPYRYGEDFFNGLVSWVPRFLWEDKPGTFFIGRWFRQVYQPEMENGWPISAVGSWYVNLGGVGVMLGGFVTGLILKRLDTFGASGQDKLIFSLFLTVFVVGLGFDTSLFQDIFLYVIPVLIVVLLARVKLKVLSR